MIVHRQCADVPKDPVSRHCPRHFAAPRLILLKSNNTENMKPDGVTAPEKKKRRTTKRKRETDNTERTASPVLQDETNMADAPSPAKKQRSADAEGDEAISVQSTEVVEVVTVVEEVTSVPLAEAPPSVAEEECAEDTEPAILEAEPEARSPEVVCLSETPDPNPTVNLYVCDNHDTHLKCVGGCLLVVATDDKTAKEGVDKWLVGHGLKPCSEFAYKLEELQPNCEGVHIVASRNKKSSRVTVKYPKGEKYRLKDFNVFIYKDLDATMPRMSGAIVFAPRMHAARRLLREHLEREFPEFYKGAPDRTNIPIKLKAAVITPPFEGVHVFPLSDTMMMTM